jgi:hypothetical protein
MFHDETSRGRPACRWILTTSPKPSFEGVWIRFFFAFRPADARIPSNTLCFVAFLQHGFSTQRGFQLKPSFFKTRAESWFSKTQITRRAHISQKPNRPFGSTGHPRTGAFPTHWLRGARSHPRIPAPDVIWELRAMYLETTYFFRKSGKNKKLL